MLEEKLDQLTKEVVALRKVIEENGLNVGAPVCDREPEEKKTSKKAATSKGKKKAAAPEHDADEVGAILRKAATEVSKPDVQKYIKDQDCADLAELLTKPELFDAAYAFGEKMLDEADEEEEDEI